MSRPAPALNIKPTYCRLGITAGIPSLGVSELLASRQHRHTLSFMLMSCAVTGEQTMMPWLNLRVRLWGNHRGGKMQE